MSNELTLWLIPQEIDFFPKTELHEIIQNIITICTTMKYSVPLDREFGVNARFLDDPVNSSRAKITSEIIQAVRQFENRAKVTRIDYEYNTEHSGIFPKLTIRLNTK